MTVLQAILPVLGLLAGGACVGAFAYFGKRKHEKDGLPTDPLTELFVNDDDTISVSYTHLTLPTT